MKKILYPGLVVFLVQLLFSCSSAEYYRFASTQQEAYKKVKENPGPEAIQAVVLPKQVDIAAATTQPVKTVLEPEPVLEANAQATKATIPKGETASFRASATGKNIPATKTELSPQEEETLAMAKSQLAHLNTVQKNQLKSDLKEVLEIKATSTNIIEIILAVLLPPLAVFLHEGITNRFWISLLLTLLFWIPGVIYALLVVTDTI